eukprot:scaffold4499_cov122-Isochrysis_galbana.AAC.8
MLTRYAEGAKPGRSREIPPWAPAAPRSYLHLEWLEAMGPCHRVLNLVEARVGGSEALTEYE